MDWLTLGMLARVLGFWLACYVLILAGLWAGQRKLLYFPDQRETSPADAGLAAVTAHRLATHDGERVIVWHAPARPGMRTIVYFHGNGGAIAYRASRFARFVEKGFGLAALSYRGYAGSTGSPSESANVKDGALLLDWLGQRGVRPEDIVLFGESLGTGIAVQLASARPIAAMVLDSPYSSIADLAASKLAWFPVRSLVSDRYDSMAHIGSVKAPLLIVHGEQDVVIPAHFGRRLFAAANEPKQLATFAGWGHTPPFEGEVWRTIAAFLKRHGKAATRD